MMRRSAALLGMLGLISGSVPCLQTAAADPTTGMTQSAVAVPAGNPPTPEAVARGQAIYSQACAVCHGLAGKGGPGGAADLTTSAIAMADDAGAGLGAFLATGRPERGMPAHAVSAEDAAALSATLRSFGFAAARRPNDAAPASVLVGDVAAGKTFFNGPVGRCASCHAVGAGMPSSAINLSGVASKYATPKALQDAMILPARRFYWSPANGHDVSATVTYQDGHTVSGYLSSVSDFKVIVRREDGSEITIPREGGEPRVALTDRLQHHLDLLRVYRDNDIHDLTAYLATLK